MKKFKFAGHFNGIVMMFVAVSALYTNSFDFNTVLIIILNGFFAWFHLSEDKKGDSNE